MILPDKMLCRSRFYKLVKSNNLAKEGAEGSCYFVTKILEIDCAKKNEHTAEIIFHEWGHGIWFEQGLNEEPLPEMLEHMVISPFAKDMVVNRKEIVLILLQIPGMKKYVKSILDKI